MIATQTGVTAEELWRMPDDGVRRELVRGELRETMPPGVQHGIIAAKVVARLMLWVQSGPGGYVGVESGFRLARDPDTVRGPDVFFLRAGQWPAGEVPVGFGEVAPDLVVEVVSPGESAEERRERLAEYMQAGVRLMWEVYPRQREVVAHTPDGRARTFRSTDTLEDAEVLPGFACSVAELFA